MVQKLARGLAGPRRGRGSSAPPNALASGRMSSERFAAAVTAFDTENALDPKREIVDGVARPHELVHAERLSAWVVRLDPDASEALRLAARCQHIRRWTIPRSEYPAGRVGYLQWRTQLGRMHAAIAAEILARVGYDAALIEQVRRINTKQGLRSNADAQTMEDALCLAFLEHEAADFAAKHPREKVIDILRKSWKKMSPKGREAALAAPLPSAVQALVRAALASSAAGSGDGGEGDGGQEGDSGEGDDDEGDDDEG